jgi:hypothetical protein
MSNTPGGVIPVEAYEGLTRERCDSDAQWRTVQERDEARRDLAGMAAERDAERDRCMDLGAELVEWRHDATEEQRAAIKARCGGKDPLAAMGSKMAMVQFAVALDAMQELQWGEREDAEDELRYAFIRVCLERDGWRKKAEARGAALERISARCLAAVEEADKDRRVMRRWQTLLTDVAIAAGKSAAAGVNPALLQDGEPPVILPEHLDRADAIYEEGREMMRVANATQTCMASRDRAIGE